VETGRDAVYQKPTLLRGDSRSRARGAAVIRRQKMNNVSSICPSVSKVGSLRRK
jgi:hypothetical protein